MSIDPASLRHHVLFVLGQRRKNPPQAPHRADILNQVEPPQGSAFADFDENLRIAVHKAICGSHEGRTASFNAAVDAVLADLEGVGVLRGLWCRSRTFDEGRDGRLVERTVEGNAYYLLPDRFDALISSAG